MNQHDPKSISSLEAFTIIELLIVITILALLTSLAATNYLATQKRSRDSARKVTINTIAGAVENFYSINRNFPGDPYVSSSVPTQKIVTDSSLNLCETASQLNSGTNQAPYYSYFPGQDCSAGTSLPSNSGSFGYNKSDYLPKGTWIPRLGNYLSPVPSEINYRDASGTKSMLPSDVLDSNLQRNGSQSIDRSRTLSYRNFQSGYLVYARLESDTDSAFTTQFNTMSKSHYMCLPDLPGTVAISTDLSCLPDPSNPSNPIVLYLLRK